MQKHFTPLRRRNAIIVGGYMEVSVLLYFTRGLGLLRSPLDMGNLFVAEHVCVPIRMLYLVRIASSLLRFGSIVDGAVIVVVNVFRRLSERGKGEAGSLRTVIQEAAFQVGRPTFFSMLFIILAHVPIFTLQRHEGRIFAPMAWTVVSALIGSLLFSLTLVPLLCLAFLRKGLPERENPIVRFVKRLYRPALELALRMRVAVVGWAILA